MDTIRTYLENMFLHVPDSSEVRRAKEELLAMMEDKYEELKAGGKKEHEAVGIVISEFGNLEELAESLGIASCMGEESREQEKQEKEQEPVISLLQVEEYLGTIEKTRKKIAVGVTLCIWSPVFLILAGGFAKWKPALFDEKWVVVLGVFVLLAMVAVAVVLFILNGLQMEKYEYLKKTAFTLEKQAEQLVRREQEKFASAFRISVAVGVALCILCAVPLIGASVLGHSMAFLGFPLLLAMVGIAVYLFVFMGQRWEAYKILLQEEEYRRGRKTNTLMQNVSSIYWSLAAAIYLFWSFSTDGWDRTWIVWPVAGVLFGAVAVICRLLGEKN